MCITKYRGVSVLRVEYTLLVCYSFFNSYVVDGWQRSMSEP